MNEFEKVPWLVTLGIVSVCTIICNFIFIVVFFKRATLRRRRSSLLLVSLTAADLIVGAMAIPMYMAYLWPGSEVANSTTLRRWYALIDVLSSFASLFGLTVIALKRVYSVFRPRQHRSLSKTPYCAASLVSWILAAATASLILLRDDHVIMFKVSCVSGVVIIITASHSVLWIKIKTNKNDVMHLRRVKRERKLANTLALLTGVLLITWFPFLVVNAVNLRMRDKVPLHLVFTSELLHYSNSLANPVLYSLSCPEVRRTLTNIQCRRKQIIVANAAKDVRLAVRGGVREGD